MQATVAPPVNHWPNSKCAKAFWGQHELPPYKQLLADTADWLEPQPGENWLDLGCGCGQLTQALWEKSGGRVGSILGIDIAAVNEQAYARLRSAANPAANKSQIAFQAHDFSNGLPFLRDGEFDGIVSGLSIQYAEHYSNDLGRWTTRAYDRLLGEIYRVLRPGSTFVFSVNVPEPAWGKVAIKSLSGVFHVRKPARYLKNSWRMMRYGRWLSGEARTGRFLYLPIGDIRKKLSAAGFYEIEDRLTYVGQAYLIRCKKPA